MVKICVNNYKLCEIINADYEQIVNEIVIKTNLRRTEFYLVQNGKRLCSDSFECINATDTIHCALRVHGGKGGFGSMLRAIGAQIEKTTNREACRDLSGRRLRDINEEKRLKAWLEKQSEREREAEERKKRKIEKLLAVPKHEFKDEKYEEARSKLTEKVNDAVEEGFKKVLESKESSISTTASSSSGLKRKGDYVEAVVKVKKTKAALWISDDLSDTDTDDASDSDITDVPNKEAMATKI